MSFDLAVFRTRTTIDGADAPAIYRALCEGAEPSSPLEASPRLAAFYAALTARFPELDDDEDESPFATAIVRTDRYVVMSVSFSRAAEVAYAVAVLAREHDLDVYDPQANALRRPSDRLPKAPPKAPKPRDAAALFAEALTPKLEGLGFARVAAHEWSRTTTGRVVQRVGLDLATRQVRPSVGFAHVDALAAVARALGEAKLSPPMMGLEHLHFGGWIPGEPWAANDVEAPFHHTTSNPAAPAALAKEIARFALPLFESVATLDDAARFFAAERPPSAARTNWGIEREVKSGPAGRFWRVDRGLLLVTATRALAAPAQKLALFEAARDHARDWAAREVWNGGPALDVALTRLAEEV